MRILAIRGANLASLKGSFEVDLGRPPLSQLGLFAIAGPVGAGKSTLLDAMCLALFNRTPRLSGRGGSPVLKDGEAIRANDPRSLVRRGCGSAFAEVDFVGADGRAYRSRWQCRRARGADFGRLQDETVTLVELDATGATEGKRIGEGKEDTLAHVGERLGLSFEELCRSVLLAQGGFAGFLKAKPEERASLLEKITGTDVYSLLSIQAHERARDEAARLRALEDDLAAFPPADDVARAALEADEARAAAARAHARMIVEQAEERARRAARRRELSESVSAAQQSLQQAQQQRSSSTAHADVLALAKAWPLRTLARDLERAEARARATATALASAQESERKARSSLAALHERKTRAADALQAASQAATEAEPALARAALLDEQLARCLPHELVDECERMMHERAGADAALDDVKARAQDAERALQDAQGALAREPALAALLPAWPAIAQLLEELGALETRAQGALALALAASEAFDAAALDEEGARRASDAARDRADAARSRLAALFALEDASAALDIVPGRLAKLEAARSERARLATRLAELQQAQGRAVDDVKRAEQASKRAQTLHDEAARALSKLAHAAGRAGLVDGEACPLCGSLEHPARHEPSPADDVVAAERNRVALLADAARKAGEERAAALARANAAERAVDDATRALADVDATLSATGASGLRSDADLRAAHALVDSARAAVAAVVDAERLLSETVHTREAASHAASLQQQQQAALEDAAARCRASLRAIGAGGDVDAEPNGSVSVAGRRGSARAVAREVAGVVDGLRVHEDKARAARAELTRVAPELRSLESRAVAARVSAAELERRLANARDDETRLRAARLAVLDGEDVAVVRSRLAGALDEARAAAGEAASALAQAEAGAAAAAARLASALDDDDEARRARAECVAALERARAQGAVDVAAVARAAALPDHALDDAKAAIRALDDDVARAEAVLAERRAQLDAEGADGDDDAGGAGGAVVDEAKRALDEMNDTWSAARAAVMRDDEARARAAEKRPLLEAQRERSATWSKLADVIGSADGARFRVFAQSLTLDALLVRANAQLALLAPRYRLERAPSNDKRPRFDLELVVVDRESGDEPRAVGSLSGGETFLVSLALALGLSALSSSRTRVESLFIDEGFSSLDPDTLECALAALEALRATGRQIGVISHVPALVERLGAQVRVVPLGGGRSRVDISLAG